MDVLFGKANRQIASIRADLDRLLDPSSSKNIISQQGQFMASLTTFGKTLNDLEEMVKREMSMEKRTIYKERLSKLKLDQDNVKTRFNEAKQAQRAKERQSERDSLLGPSPHHSQNPLNSTATPESQLTESLLKERESRTLDYAGTRLDEIIAVGQSALEGVRNQRGTLKSAHRRVLDAATSLGLSKSVIRVIERKSAQDKYIFWTGVIITIGVIYLCYRYFSS